MTTELSFSYPRIIAELQSFARVFGDFVDPGSEQLSALWVRLESAQQRVAPGDGFRWIIGDPSAVKEAQQPIRTKRSRMDEERREWREAYGEFFMVWRLKQGPRVKGQRTPMAFEVESASSTCVIWKVDGDDEVEAARWNFDIGNSSAPGCRLHVQAYSDAIEIPRLHSLCILPHDILTFVANELFPRSWRSRVASSSEARFHGPKQASRVAALLSNWVKAVNSTDDPFRELADLRAYSCIAEIQ